MQEWDTYLAFSILEEFVAASRMGVNNFHRINVQLERSQLRMRIVFLILAALTIAVGLVLAVIIFFYLLRFSLHPANLKPLVDEWSLLLMEASQNDNSILSPTEGPARWFAIVTLLILGFLTSRIPLLLIQMGTLLFNASQDNQRQTKAILKEVLMELRHSTPPLETAQPELNQPSAENSGSSELPTTPHQN